MDLLPTTAFRARSEGQNIIILKARRSAKLMPNPRPADNERFWNKLESELPGFLHQKGFMRYFFSPAVSELLEEDPRRRRRGDPSIRSTVPWGREPATPGPASNP